MNHSLFRSEVLAERETQWLGSVLLTPRLSYRVFTVFAVVATGAMLCLLFFVDYTRKERINGWLVPQHGLIRVFTPQAGVVTQLDAYEGMEVRKGMPLLRLSAELQSASLGATQTEIARQLQTRRQSLSDERHHQELLLAQQKQTLTERLETLRSEQAQIDSEMALQTARIELAKKAEHRQKQLHQRGLVADRQVQEAAAFRMEQNARRHAIERNRLAIRRTQLNLESERQDLPLQVQARIANIERRMAEVSQQLAEVEARREIVISAPESGTVTTIQAEQGERVNAAAPILSIIPAGTQLEAHLFSPSRAIGFVQADQRVLLRYQAYPYQKFGHHEGHVTNISRSAVTPGELPTHLADITRLFGTNEPVYRIVVTLKRQGITAYGRIVPLQPGMQLEGDVIIERRRLIEWALDPLYTLTGRLNG